MQTDDGFNAAEMSDIVDNDMRKLHIDCNRPMIDSELEELDRQARAHYDIKTMVLVPRIVPKPSINALYYNQQEVIKSMNSSVPKDLGLHIFFEHFNHVRIPLSLLLPWNSH